MAVKVPSYGGLGDGKLYAGKICYLLVSESKPTVQAPCVTTIRLDDNVWQENWKVSGLLSRQGTLHYVSANYKINPEEIISALMFS